MPLTYIIIEINTFYIPFYLQYFIRVSKCHYLNICFCMNCWMIFWPTWNFLNKFICKSVKVDVTNTTFVYYDLTLECSSINTRWSVQVLSKICHGLILMSVLFIYEHICRVLLYTDLKVNRSTYLSIPSSSRWIYVWFAHIFLK